MISARTRPGMEVVEPIGFPFFSIFDNWWNTLPNYVHICQVSPQLNFGDTSEIGMGFSISNGWFYKLRTVLNGEIKESGLCKLHTWHKSVINVEMALQCWLPGPTIPLFAHSRGDHRGYHTVFGTKDVSVVVHWRDPHGSGQFHLMP